NNTNTADANDHVRQTKKRLNVNKEISIIYNFEKENEYSKKYLEDIKKQYRIQPDEKVVIHISNIRKVKRVEDVIYTFEKIRNHVKAKLLMVGDGPECAGAFELVNKLKLSDSVLFLGKQKNVSDLLS